MGLFGPNKVDLARREKVMGRLAELVEGGDVTAATRLASWAKATFTPRGPDLYSLRIDSDDPLPLLQGIVGWEGEPNDRVALKFLQDIFVALKSDPKTYSVRKKTQNIAWDLYEVLNDGRPEAGLYCKNLAMLGLPNP
jgi:hypothetical protein